jgi:hypothetical protein
LAVCEYWKCPRCGRIERKYFSYGPVVGSSGPYQARHIFHKDVKCQCGQLIPGGEIVGGMHDDHTADTASAAPGCGCALGVAIGLVLLYALDAGAPAFWLSLIGGAALGFIVQSRLMKRLKP